MKTKSLTLLAAAVMAASVAGGLSSTASAGPETVGAFDPGSGLAAIAGWLGARLAVIGGLVGSVLVLVWIVRRSGGPAIRPAGAPIDVDDEAAEVLERARRRLVTSTEVRRDILDTWLALEAVLGRAGITRQVSDTPTEYLARGLPALSRSRDSARRLTELVELAMFSERSMGRDEADEAVRCLDEIVAELRSSEHRTTPEVEHVG